MAIPTKQEVKQWVDLYVRKQGEQSGLDGLDEILDILIEVAWSGTPGPGPDLDKCVQVDRAQAFTDAEKEQGRDNLGITEVDTSKCVKVDRIQGFSNAEKVQGIDNLGPQHIQDAIKELVAILKNKTIDADDNTIENLTGENVKSGYLVGNITASDKYFGWKRIGYPAIYTKTTADAPSVDIYGLTAGKMTLVGTARISAGNLVRDTVVYARDASLDNYFVDDSAIKFAGLDLAIKLLNLIEAIKVTYKKVSTFTGVTGDTETLYYLDTAYDNYEKGFYVFTGSAFVNVDQKCVKFVSTFTGVEGDTDVLYYLDTAYDSYKVGFYRFVPAAGTTPAKFVPLGSDADVFTDVDELPDTDISKSTIYRVPYSYYEYQGQKVEKEDAVFYGPGALCLNMACDNTNGLSLQSSSQSYQYPLADITDALVQQLITDQLIQVKSTETDAPMFKVATNSYCPSEDVTEVDGGYKLYHNPTQTAGEYIEIGGGEADVFTDVDSLPSTGISKNTIYRMLVDRYKEDGTMLPSVPTGYVSIRPAIVIIDENGITDNGTLYPWADITDDQMDFWVIRRQISQVYAADLMTMSTCFKTADNHYVYKDHVTKEQVYELYHNPTQAAGGYIKIGGESVESPFVAGTGTNSAVLKGGNNLAMGTLTVAEGKGTIAGGKYSHAEGQSALTGGLADASHAEGIGTLAHNPGEHAEGQYNSSYFADAGEEDFGTRHSVGIGTSNSDRKNAVEIIANGEMFIKGAGGYDGTDMRQGTGADMKINPDVKSVQELLSQIPTDEQKLTINASGESVLSVNKVGNAPVNSMEYSLDGKKWTSATLPLSVVFTNRIHLRGNAQSCASSLNDYVNIDVQGGGGNQKEFTVEGNIMALLYGSNVYGKTELPASFSFAKLFAGTKITNAGGLILPANKLTLDCYHAMFDGCSELSAAPALPATVLAQSCYQEMFKDCTSLDTAPSLQATTVATSCYNSMFEGCTALVNCFDFPTSVAGSTESFCSGMFFGCTSLVSSPRLPMASALGNNAYQAMFSGCSSLRNAPEIPAVSVGKYACYEMFNGCVALENAPAILPAMLLGDEAYTMMFANCTALQKAPKLPAEVIATNSYSHMFYGCTSLQKAPELPATSLGVRAYNAMFANCTSLQKAPVLPAKVLAEGCYHAMFGGCSILDEVTILAEDISATGCLTGWLGNVAASGTFRKKAGVAFPIDNPDGIPVGWTVEEISEDNSNVFTDVDSLPDTGISKNTIYRTRDVSYEYEGVQFPKSELVWYGPGPDCTSMDADDVGVNIRAASGNRSYPWGTINAALIQELQDLNLVAVGVDEADAVFFSHSTTYGPKSGLTTIYGDYHIYHNPTETAGGYIEIGGGGSAKVDNVTTEEVNGKLQANAVIVVNALPTTDIKTKSIYRRMTHVYRHDGVEVNSVSPYKVRANDTIEATPDGLRYKPEGPTVAWTDSNIAQVVSDGIVGGYIEATTWENADFFGYGDDPAAGNFDYKNHFSRLLPGSLWQNPTGTADGWDEVGKDPAIDEVTIVEENSILQAVAVIDVTSLPSAGMKANSLYRKVETVYVPGLHIYTTYYHGGADPVPEPVECYKPARAGVEFRTNEIYIDGVEHSYEELKAYRADWVAAGYIVACDFLDIDTTTNDGAVGYPNEGSYQFLNRARYTYNTDPVPVVMNKIFQYTPGGAWESISTVQISNAAYNQLDYDQKMDGTTYIVEG